MEGELDLMSYFDKYGHRVPSWQPFHILCPYLIKYYIAVGIASISMIGVSYLCLPIILSVVNGIKSAVSISGNSSTPLLTQSRGISPAMEPPASAPQKTPTPAFTTPSASLSPPIQYANFVYPNAAIRPESLSQVSELIHWDNVWSSRFTFSPDGSKIATCIFHSDSDTGTIRLLSMTTQQLLWIYKGHLGECTSIAFGSDGRVLASGGVDGTVRLWDVISGKSLRTLNGAAGFVRSVAFSPIGNLLASSYGGSNLVELWNPETGELVLTIKGNSVDVNDLEFSPDGQILATGGSNNTVQLWNVTSGQLIHELASRQGGIHLATLLYGGSTNGVYSIAFSPDGSTLTSGGEDGKIQRWSVSSGKLIQQIIIGSKVNSVSYSPDGRILASGSDDAKIRFWDAASGGLLRVLDSSNARSIRQVAFSPDGRILTESFVSLTLFDSSSSRQGYILRLWSVSQ